ncbi:hypothetical protein [Paenibacillus radicis (ex Xue et al. 2023)]|uniref:LysM domain-containing protein n=1 Tax=Paenibacillus radicis (ex Xue et al. 2023) TaxID=2972489 RepID=A0ABT1YMZ7_9BACL|nr:hypothetical protein [Paenibacillus radicis (ex Xue et al. 2023)]MCR8634555.1 hypothetical protein [Paenibacillus radicis (ex Xue et al. 2023)]
MERAFGHGGFGHGGFDHFEHPAFIPQRRFTPYFFLSPFFFRGNNDTNGTFFTQHQCNEGDTIGTLAEMYNVPQPILETMNPHIQNSEYLAPGSIANIPRLDKMYCHKMFMEQDGPGTDRNSPMVNPEPNMMPVQEKLHMHPHGQHAHSAYPYSYPYPTQYYPGGGHHAGHHAGHHGFGVHLGGHLGGHGAGVHAGGHLGHQGMGVHTGGYLGGYGAGVHAGGHMMDHGAGVHLGGHLGGHGAGVHAGGNLKDHGVGMHVGGNLGDHVGQLGVHLGGHVGNEEKNQ